MQISFWLRKMMMLYSEKALQIIFKSSQTYTIEGKWKSCDVFLVGGGGSSTDASYDRSRAVAVGGQSGGGGFTKTQKNIDITNADRTISITVGAGAVRPTTATVVGGQSKVSITIGGTTTDYTAEGGNQRYISNRYQVYQMAGGSGGGNPAYASNSSGAYAGGNGADDGNNAYNDQGRIGGQGQGTTTRAFEEADGTLYAGGGRGGAAWYRNASGSIEQVMPQGNQSTGRGTNMGSGANGQQAILNEYLARYLAQPGLAGDAGIVIIRLYKNSNRPTDIDWSKCTITL